MQGAHVKVAWKGNQKGWEKFFVVSIMRIHCGKDGNLSASRESNFSKVRETQAVEFLKRVSEKKLFFTGKWNYLKLHCTRELIRKPGSHDDLKSS